MKTKIARQDILLMLSALFFMTFLTACSRGSGGAQVNPDGTVTAATFSKSFGGPRVDFAVGASAHPDGGYAFAGNLADSTKRDLYGGDSVVGRLDANGNLIWQTALGFRNVSRDVAHGSYSAGPANNDEFCIAALAQVRNLSDSDAYFPEDAYAARVNGNGQLLWETTFDSEPWGPYEYPPFGGDSVEARERGVNAIGDGSGGCYALYESQANLFDQNGVGFDGYEANVIALTPAGVEYGRTFVGAKSLVLARVDANGVLLWQRRLVNGAFARAGIDFDTYPPQLFITAQGILVQYSWKPDGTWGGGGKRLSVLGHFDRDGRVQFIREYEITGYSGVQYGPSVRATVEQIDDLTDGARDGLKDDGFVVAYPSRLMRLGPGGQVLWEKPLPQFSVVGVGQQCDGPNCYLVAIGVHQSIEQTRTLTGRVRTFEEDTGNDFPFGEFDDPLSEDYFASVRIDSRTIRAFIRSGDGSISARDVSFLPSDSIQAPQIVFDNDQQISGISFPLNPYEMGQPRFYGNGAFLANKKIIDISTFAAGFMRIDLGAANDNEFLADMTTTSQGNHVAVGYSSGTTQGGFIVGLNDLGEITWQHHIASIDSIESVIARPEGGVVVAARLSPHRIQALAFAEDGQFIWQSPTINPSQFVQRIPSLPDSLDYEADHDYVPRILSKSRNGYLIGSTYPGLTTPNQYSGAWLAELSDRGEINWIRGYNIAVESAVVTAEGLIKLSTTTVDGFMIATLDETGNVIDGQRYFLPAGSPLHALVTDAGNGAVNIMLATLGLIGGSGVEGAVKAIGEQNVTTIRIDANGAAAWARVHGGLYNEWSENSATMADGGLLMAGSSDSLGDRSEMWLLRLGGDGLVDESCNALLGSIPGELFRRVDAALQSVSFAAPTESASLSLTNPEFQTFSVDLVEARQCFAQSTAAGSVPSRGGLQTLTVNQGGSIDGLVISTPSGVFCGGNTNQACTADFAPESLVTLKVDDSSATTFRGWGDGCLETRSGPYRCIVRMSSDHLVDAFFEPFDGTTVSLTTNVVGFGRVFSADDAGINCASDNSGNDCQQDYPLGQRVRLTVDDGYGGAFQGWGDDCTEWARAGTIRVTLDANKICAAQFSGTPPPPTTHPLTVTVLVDGQAASVTSPGGRVNSSPNGISCGSPGPGCSADFAIDSVVDLTASPITGFNFVGWSSPDVNSGCYASISTTVSVTMSSTLHCIAQFVTQGTATYNMTITVLENNRVPVAGGPFGGRVTSSPPGFDCGPAGSDCFESFVDGAQVTLTPTPEPGYQFSGWGAGSGSGDCAPGSPAVTTVTVDGNLGCIAMFDTIAGTGNNNVSILFDAPASGARVVDVTTGTLDCTATCTVPLPVSQSPIQLRPINQGARWTAWNNCDAVIADPANPGGPLLCEIDITSGQRGVTVEFGL